MDFRELFGHIQRETNEAPAVTEREKLNEVAECGLPMRRRNRQGTRNRRSKMREHTRYITKSSEIRSFSSIFERLTKERAELSKHVNEAETSEEIVERIAEVNYKLKRLAKRIEEGINGLKPAYALPDGSVAHQNRTTARWDYYARSGGAWRPTKSSDQLRLSTGELISNPNSEQAKILGVAVLTEKKFRGTLCPKCGLSMSDDVDDMGTSTYKCDHCRYERAKRPEEMDDIYEKKTKVNESKFECDCGWKGSSAGTDDEEYYICPECGKRLGDANESKVNEDEGLTAGGPTQANSGDRTQDPNYGAPDPVVKPEAEGLKRATPENPNKEPEKKEELPIEGEKEYLGNKGGEEYFYFVIIPSEDGTKDLQIQDANDEVVFSAKENQIDAEDNESFLWRGIQELQLSNIATEIVDKYLMPDEVPEDIEMEQEEEVGQGEEGQEQPETKQPKESGAIPELGAPAFKSSVGESKVIPVLELKMKKLMCKYGLNKTGEIGENMVEKLMEKYGLKESEIDVLLEKYGLNEAEPGSVLPKAPKNIEDLEKGAVGDQPAPASANVSAEDSSKEINPEPGMETPAATEPAPEGGTPKSTDMLSSESATADIKVKYPEEPYTTTAMSYADSLIDDPKVYGTIRNLKWPGVYANSETFLKQAKIVGKYNEFNPDIAQRLVDAVGEGAKFRLAREGSVSVYFTIRDPNKRISLATLKDLVRADEADETGNAGEARLWWD